MCSVCGCEQGQSRIEGEAIDHEHHGHHDHDHHHEGDTHHYGQGPARAHVPGLSQSRMVQIERNILGKNDEYARANRRWFAAHGVLALNLVSGPGAGKTTLLTRTLTDLGDELPMAVIEGDQETDHDAERIRATGVRAIQVNTGKGCHLDAHQVGHAAQALGLDNDLDGGGLLFIENVGNLVCPAAFDLGEAHKVAILSVTEGEDKPIKYPDLFHAADLLLLNKTDLLPYVQFDLQRCMEYARRVNPDIQILPISATTGEGMDAWLQWLRLARRIRQLGAAPKQP